MIMILSLALLAGQTSPKTSEAWPAELAAQVDSAARKGYPWSSKTNVISQKSTDNANPIWYISDGTTLRAMTREEVDAYDARQTVFNDLSAEASQLFNRMDLRRARAKLEPMMRTDDLHYSASLLLAQIAALEGDYDEAILLIEPFIDVGLVERDLLVLAYSGSHKGQVYAGQDAYCDKRLRASATSITEGVSSLANDSRTLSALALAADYYGTGQDDQAMKYYYEVVDREPQNPIANWSLAKFLQRRGLYDQALMRCEIAATHGNAKLKKIATREARSLRWRIEHRSVTTGGTGGA